MNLTRRCFLRTLGVAAGAAAAPLGGFALAAPDPHEALYYSPLEERLVRCELCPRRCVVPDGGRGYCRVRENQGGRYVSLVYERPVTMNNDPIEKKPFFHVYPGSKALSIATVGCNIHCRFCQNWEISQASPGDIAARPVSPAQIAELAVKQGARTVAYTYNEPTVFYEYVSDCARAAADRGIGSIMVSNGYIQEKPLRALIPLLTAYKVDLKAFTEKFYTDVCEGELAPVLRSLEVLADTGIWFEIVVLVIPTQNDSMDELKRMSAWIVEKLGPHVPVHFTRFHPSYKLRNIPPTPVRTLQAARELAMREGCRFVYTGNMPGGKGENTYCPACGAAVVERYGFLSSTSRLVKGACAACGTPIPGVWDDAAGKTLKQPA